MTDDGIIKICLIYINYTVARVGKVIHELAGRFRVTFPFYFFASASALFTLWY